MLLTLTLFTGCFKQDYSLCRVEDNCVLLFELEGVTRSSDFTQTIHTIDVVLFDEQCNLSQHKTVTKSQLDEFQGVRLTVEPGIYHVVAWANVTPNTELSTNNGVPPTAFSASYLSTVSNATGCNIYYAPKKTIEHTRPDGVTPDQTIYQVEVIANEITTKKLPFSRVNRRVNVFLKGFDEDQQVLLCNIPDKYDYYLRAYSSRKEYRQTTREVPDNGGEALRVASFRAPIVPFEQAMTVNLLKTGAGADQVLKTLNLKQWVEDNISNIKDLNEIDILFTKGPGAVITIEAPNWNDNDTKPIW